MTDLVYATFSLSRITVETSNSFDYCLRRTHRLSSSLSLKRIYFKRTIDETTADWHDLLYEYSNPSNEVPQEGNNTATQLQDYQTCEIVKERASIQQYLGICATASARITERESALVDFEDARQSDIADAEDRVSSTVQMLSSILGAVSYLPDQHDLAPFTEQVNALLTFLQLIEPYQGIWDGQSLNLLKQTYKSLLRIKEDINKAWRFQALDWANFKSQGQSMNELRDSLKMKTSALIIAVAVAAR